MWIECVPNFSEGRAATVLDGIVAAIESASGVVLLDSSRDEDHNRAVVTFAGEPAAVVEGALRGARAAAQAIDLARHEGVHPRIGALDVCPFVPLEGATDADCRAAAHALGARAVDELALPVYFYGGAAPADRPRSLPELRRSVRAGEPPDLGPATPHPTAGSIAIGVRPVLIAYNVELQADDLGLAQEIARRVRESNGGLTGVRALGFSLASKGISQVSLNVCDHRAASLIEVFDAIEREARALGVEVGESELVGLAPRSALSPETARYVRLRDFVPERMWIEARLDQGRAQ